MNALGPITPSVPSTMPPSMASGSMTAAREAPSATSAGDRIIRLDIRRDDEIERVVFEYRKTSNGQLVQRFPARQVVQFYQRMEAVTESGSAPAGESDPARPSAANTERAAGFDRLDREIPVLEPAASGGAGGGALRADRMVSALA
jgi:hypothetical protein